jgi:hypothetical protein
VIVRLRGSDYPLVTSIVVAIGGERQVSVPLDKVSSFDGDVLKLTTAELDLRSLERRDGEVLFSADVPGYRLIDVGPRLDQHSDNRPMSADRCSYVVKRSSVTKFG